MNIRAHAGNDQVSGIAMKCSSVVIHVFSWTNTTRNTTISLCIHCITVSIRGAWQMAYTPKDPSPVPDWLMTIQKGSCVERASKHESRSVEFVSTTLLENWEVRG